MRLSDILLLLTIAGVLSLVGVVLTGLSTRWHERRLQRLKIIERALERPDLDAATRRDLVSALALQHPGWRWLRNATVWRLLSFGVGWMLFLVFGGGLVLDFLGLFRHGDREVFAGMSLIGLAMMTLPLALRELLRREQGVAPNR